MGPQPLDRRRANHSRLWGPESVLLFGHTRARGVPDPGPQRYREGDRAGIPTGVPGLNGHGVLRVVYYRERLGQHVRRRGVVGGGAARLLLDEDLVVAARDHVVVRGRCPGDGHRGVGPYGDMESGRGVGHAQIARVDPTMRPTRPVVHADLRLVGPDPG